MKRLDLRGERVHDWQIRNLDPVIRNGATYWWAECMRCNKTVRLVSGADINSGRSQDCGCNRTQKLNEKTYKHGMSHHRLHAIWRVIMDRCYNPRNARYHQYGGKGVTVDQPWHEFKQFYQDLGEGGPGMKLVRFDKAGSYTPENYGWSTKYQTQKHGYAGNGKNSRSTHPIYAAWKSMKQRCNYPKHASARWYSLEGVSYPTRWETFPPFRADMEPTWFPGAELDRIDPTKPYSPENCHWIEPDTGRQRSHIMVKLPDGSEVNRAEACRKLGLEYTLVARLMYRKQMSFEQALAHIKAQS